MAWRLPGNKLLSEPMMVNLPMHRCVTWPQWVKIVCFRCLYHCLDAFIIVFMSRSLSLCLYHCLYIAAPAYKTENQGDRKERQGHGHRYDTTSLSPSSSSLSIPHGVDTHDISAAAIIHPSKLLTVLAVAMFFVLICLPCRWNDGCNSCQIGQHFECWFFVEM